MSKPKLYGDPTSIIATDRPVGGRMFCRVCGYSGFRVSRSRRHLVGADKWYTTLTCAGCGSRESTWYLELTLANGTKRPMIRKQIIKPV